MEYKQMQKLTVPECTEKPSWHHWKSRGITDKKE